MHPFMRSIVIIMMLFSVLLSFLPACKDDEPSVSDVEFRGIVFRDELGNHTGTYGGTDDNDWSYDSLWTPETWAILNFPDTVGLAGTFLYPTYAAPGPIQLSFFPNPVNQNTNAYLILPGKIKVKMALMDREMNVIFKHVYIDSDTSWTILDFSDTTKFVEGEVYRLIYTMSVDGDENFYKGHGDILMCSKLQSQCLDYLEEE